MTLTLTPTNSFVAVSNVVARRWEGVTQHGTRIVAFVSGVVAEDPVTVPELKEAFKALGETHEEPVPYDAEFFI